MHASQVSSVRNVQTQVLEEKKNYIDLILLFLIVQHLPEIKNSLLLWCQNQVSTGSNWLKSARVMLPDLGASGLSSSKLQSHFCLCFLLIFANPNSSGSLVLSPNSLALHPLGPSLPRPEGLSLLLLGNRVPGVCQQDRPCSCTSIIWGPFRINWSH